MKASISVILFILSYSFSQANDTLYSNYTYKYDTSIKYVRKMVLTKDSGWLALTYNSRNILVKREYYADSLRITSIYCHYDYKEETGILKHVACYKDGQRDGPTAGLNEKGDTLWSTIYSEGRYQMQKKFPGYDSEGDADHFYPVMVGGLEKWQRHLMTTLRYPKEAMDKNIQGRVVISFIVSEKGKLSDFKVEQSADRPLDAEAIRVIKLSPQWSPAIRDGKKLSMRTDQSIVFKVGA